MNDTVKKLIEEKAPAIFLSKIIGVSVLTWATIGAIANLLVLLVVSISQRTRYSHYKYLISHLALVDFSCCVVLFLYGPLELREHQWIYSELSCKFIYPTITFCTNLSIGTILIIAVERYRGVMLPHLSALTRRKVCISLAIIWVFSFIVGIPNIITLKVLHYPDKDYCNEKWDNMVLRRAYGISFFIVVFFLPLLAITVMHTQIMCRVLNRDLSPSNVSQWTQKNDRRITRVLTAMIIGFFICLSPNKLLYFIWDIAPNLEKNANARYNLRTIQVLYYMRVAIDPLLYCFLDTRFKKDLKNAVRKLRGLAIFDSDTRRRGSTVTSLNKEHTINRSRGNTITQLNDVVANDNTASSTESTVVSPPTLDQTGGSPLSGSASPLVSSLYMTNL